MRPLSRLGRNVARIGKAERKHFGTHIAGDDHGPFAPGRSQHAGAAMHQLVRNLAGVITRSVQVGKLAVSVAPKKVAAAG